MQSPASSSPIVADIGAPAKSSELAMTPVSAGGNGGSPLLFSPSPSSIAVVTQPPLPSLHAALCPQIPPRSQSPDLSGAVDRFVSQARQGEGGIGSIGEGGRGSSMSLSPRLKMSQQDLQKMYAHQQMKNRQEDTRFPLSPAPP
jgi:hypothetical protein